MDLTNFTDFLNESKLRSLIQEEIKSLNEDKYKNDTRGYIDDVLSKMSRRELERTHGEYYDSTGNMGSDELLMKDIIAGKYGRREAQHWARHIDTL